MFYVKFRKFYECAVYSLHSDVSVTTKYLTRVGDRISYLRKHKNACVHSILLGTKIL